MKTKYFLIVSGSFDREPIVYDVHPTEEEIIKAIREQQGNSARIEKRYVLKKINS